MSERLDTSGSATGTTGPAGPAGAPAAARTAPATPPAGKRARTRALVIDVAAELFGAHHPDAITVDQIAERAGVSVGTIYAHFVSKEGLVLAYLEAALDGLDELVAEAAQAPSAIDRVFNYGDAYLGFAMRHPAAMRHGMMRGLDPLDVDEPVNRAISDRVQAIVLAVAKDLRGAMDDGEIPRRPLDETMIFVWGAWYGVIALMVRRNQMAIPAELAVRSLQRGRELLSQTLFQPPADGPHPPPPAAHPAN